MSADECLAVLKRLVEIYSFTDALGWLDAKHPLLNDRRPMDSKYEDVIKIVEQLETGSFI